MTDHQTTVAQLKALFDQFVRERDWKKFNSPKDLSMDIVSEAAELMDIFLYVDESKLAQKITEQRREIENEVADIAFALLNFCTTFDIDLSRAVELKMELNAKKYPAKS